MKFILNLVGTLLLSSVIPAKAMRGYDCDPSFNVRTDTAGFSGYAGSLMKSAPIERELCLGPDGLLHGSIFLVDAVGDARYIFLPYTVTDNAEKLKGLVFPLEIYISKEVVHERRGMAPVVYQRLYVVSRAMRLNNKDGAVLRFNFPHDFKFKIDTDKGEKLFNGIGGSGGNAAYGEKFSMAVDLDDAAISSLAEIKECSMTIPFAPHHAASSKADLPPFTINITLTKTGLANLQKFIKARDRGTPLKD